MLKELKNTEMINKIGGKFKLTALIQRRLQELIQGARPLIDSAAGKTYMEIAIQEIIEEKIAIDYEASGIVEPGKKPKTNE